MFQVRHTQRLLEVMVIGQFLPDNMRVLPQMLAHLAPHEVVSVLQDVWNYMRDNTPSPDKWVLLPDKGFVDPRNFETSRRLLLFNAHRLGHLLPVMLGKHPV